MHRQPLVPVAAGPRRWPGDGRSLQGDEA